MYLASLRGGFSVLCGIDKYQVAYLLSCFRASISRNLLLVCTLTRYIDFLAPKAQYKSSRLDARHFPDPSAILFHFTPDSEGTFGPLARVRLLGANSHRLIIPLSSVLYLLTLFIGSRVCHFHVRHSRRLFATSTESEAQLRPKLLSLRPIFQTQPAHPTNPIQPESW